MMAAPTPLPAADAPATRRMVMEGFEVMGGKIDAMDRRLTAGQERMQADINTLKTDVAELKTDVAELKADVAELKTDVAELKTDMRTLTGRVDRIETVMVENHTDLNRKLNAIMTHLGIRGAE